MKASHLIAFNTLVSYGQSLVGLVVGLFSARWVLEALGVVDFGLFGLVGSIIFLTNFLNTAMIVGVARFYAFSIGRGQTLPLEQSTEDLKYWFNTAFSIHLILPFILIMIGGPLGEHAIQHWLSIPSDRLEACIWAFRISMATAFIGVFSVPFISMFAAHQHITELAVFGILQNVFSFIGAWLLLQVQGDRLIVYALYMMAISNTASLIQIIRAMFKFKACRPCLSYLYNRAYLKQLFGFVGWKVFGASCFTFRDQGIPILVNLYFGPVMNAAYSVATRLSIQANSLSGAMTIAFQPALTMLEGKGDRQGMLNMALQVSKFGTLLILFFVIPIILEMNNILILWLKEPPIYAGELCRWMLAILVVDKMTAGPMLAVNAHGRIAVYDPIQGFIIILAIPLMWLFFHLDWGPAAIGYALCISMVFYCVGRLLFGKILLQFPFMPWFWQVALPVAGLIAVSTFAGFAAMQTSNGGFLRLCVTTIITSAVTTTVGWFFLLNKSERSHFQAIALKAF